MKERNFERFDYAIMIGLTAGKDCNMGIFINLEVSKSVNKEEWARVYQETLLLVENLPLAEMCTRKIHDVDTRCLVKTKEKTENYGWYNEKTRTGWFADGDYETMRRAEVFFLQKDLISESEIEPDAGDAIMGYLPAYLDISWKDERCQHTYDLWGAKTQGEPYHMYLLAVACLIEDRLKEKAFVHGDITRGQCRKAMEIANKYLAHPIEMPDRCFPDRILNRISKLHLSEQEKLQLFEHVYLGTKDYEFGECLRNYFSSDVLTTYWNQRISYYNVNQSGFRDTFQEYLTLGFDLKNLCTSVTLLDKDGNDYSEAFLQMVMDAKLHLKEKNCEDLLQIDPESEKTYGIATLWMQFCFSGARNKKIDRYIPIEEIRDALKTGIGGRCKEDIDTFIDDYLKEEEKQTAVDLNVNPDLLSKEVFEEMIERDASGCLNYVMDNAQKQIQKKAEEYDISEPEDLKFYEVGDTMYPPLATAIGKSRKFLDSILEDDRYSELLNETSLTKCEWIARQNRYLPLRDKDWEKIYSDVKEDKESFGRYFSLMLVSINSDAQVEMCIGLILNDDLYSFSRELADQI